MNHMFLQLSFLVSFLPPFLSLSSLNLAQYVKCLILKSFSEQLLLECTKSTLLRKIPLPQTESSVCM